MNQSKRSLYIKFLNDLPQMLIKIQRNVSKELLNLGNEWSESIKSEMLLVWKRKKVLKGITTKITKECNTLCRDVIAKH